MEDDCPQAGTAPERYSRGDTPHLEAGVHARAHMCACVDMHVWWGGGKEMRQKTGRKALGLLTSRGGVAGTAKSREREREGEGEGERERDREREGGRGRGRGRGRERDMKGQAVPQRIAFVGESAEPTQRDPDTSL